VTVHSGMHHMIKIASVYRTRRDMLRHRQVNYTSPYTAAVSRCVEMANVSLKQFQREKNSKFLYYIALTVNCYNNDFFSTRRPLRRASYRVAADVVKSQ
jgi:hypothetical protein